MCSQDRCKVMKAVRGRLIARRFHCRSWTFMLVSFFREWSLLYDCRWRWCKDLEQWFSTRVRSYPRVRHVRLKRFRWRFDAWFSLYVNLISVTVIRGRAKPEICLLPVRLRWMLRSAMSDPNRLLSEKVCHYLDQGRTLKDILIRAAHWMAYFDLSKLNLAFLMYWKCSNATAMVTDVIRWLWESPASKMSNSNYQNKDRLRVRRILLLQREPKLGRMRPAGST